MARVAPQPAVAHAAVVGRIALECGELRVGGALTDQRDEKDCEASDLEYVGARRVVEARDEHRQREECVERGLELEEAEELEIQVAAPAPILAELLIATFFRLAKDAFAQMPS